MNFTFSLGAQNTNAITHRFHEDFSHFEPLKHEVVQDGCAAPSEGILPSTHFWHGNQVTMAKGMCDPTLIREFSYFNTRRSSRCLAWGFQNHCKAVTPKCLPLFPILNASIFLHLLYPISLWFISPGCVFLVQRGSDAMGSMLETPDFQLEGDWRPSRDPPLGRGQCVLWMRRTMELLEVVRGWIVAEITLWVFKFHLIILFLRTWDITCPGFSCSGLGPGNWVSRRLTGWGHQRRQSLPAWP